MESNVAELPLSHRAWAWFEKNRNQALWGTAILAMVGLAVAFVLYHKQQRRDDAGRALADVTLAQAGFSGQAQESPQAFLKVALDFPNTPAAAQAVLLAGGTLFGQGKYAEAEAQFQRFTREYRETPFLGQALLGIAACLEAENKTDAALAAYKDLIARHPTDSVVPQAKFSVARIYEAQNKPEAARDYYQQVERESQYSTLGNEAGMRIEEIIQKHPELAPAPPAMPTGMPTPLPLTPTPAAPAGTGAVSNAVMSNGPAPGPIANPAPTPKK